MMDKQIVIVADQLEEWLDEPDTVVVDCRFDLADPAAGRRDYLEAHIPGAVFLDLDRDLAGPAAPATGRHPLPAVDDVVARLSSLGIGDSSRVVVYDDSNGALAARAWWILRWLGSDSVFLLDGGFRRWTQLNLPTEAGETSRRSQAFEAHVRHDRVLTTAELSSNPDRIAAFRLLDARDGARFRGEREPIDPVAGHIPGARNAPFGDFVRDDGTWLPVGERRARLLRALDGDLNSPWAVMCGSGVTACHLAISAVEAGLREPRVYVGSWSEWIRDASRPVARGAD